MADEQSNSGSITMSVLKALGGAAITVITAVLIYKLTVVPPPPAAIEVDGFVDDVTTHQLLRNASVTVTFNGQAVHQLTDASGRYAVLFPNPGIGSAMGEIATTLPGYHPFSNSVALHSGDTFAQIDIQPDIQPEIQPHGPPPVPLPGGAHIIIEPAHAALILKKPPTGYSKIPLDLAAKAKP